MIREFELLGFPLMMRRHIGDAWLDDYYFDNHMRFIRGWGRKHPGSMDPDALDQMRNRRINRA